MYELGFLLEIKRCGLEQYPILFHFEESLFVAFTAVIFNIWQNLEYYKSDKFILLTFAKYHRSINVLHSMQKSTPPKKSRGVKI